MIGELLKRGAKRVIASDVQDTSIDAAKLAFRDDIAVWQDLIFFLFYILASKALQLVQGILPIH